MSDEVFKVAGVALVVLTLLIELAREDVVILLYGSFAEHTFLWFFSLKSSDL